PRVPAHVAVPGRGVDANVVRHADLFQVLLEPAALRREEAIAPPEAGDHRTDAAELVGGLRDVAVEDGRGAERRAHGVEAREAAPHAETGDAGARRVDLGPGREPRARGLQVRERGPVLAA